MPADEDDPVVALPESVRLRVLALASEALPDLTPEQIPRPLRPIARFAPVKRAKVGASALAAAVDGDAEFRAALLERIESAQPELLAAVRADAPPAMADPVEVAALAYLARTASWPAHARRVDRLSGQRAARGQRDRRLDDVTRQRDAARSDLKRRQKETLDLTAEVRALRAQVRTLTGRLGAAERARDAAVAQLAAEREQRVAEDGAGAARLRRLHARVAELEQAAAASRRRARDAREADDARLWLLVETAGNAIRGLREELALPSTGRRPADDVDAQLGEPAVGERIERAGDLDRALQLPLAHLVIDGYNLTKTGYGELPLLAQRERLVTALGALVSRLGAEVTCVFDGATGPAVSPAAPRGVRVLFSNPGEEADELIRRLVAAEPLGRTVIVVSSDKEVAAAARRPGGYSAQSQVLLELLESS